ncbi:MAG: endonuclease, partial [Frankiales bacterium]|nr:endonuclease [Frankiales bacterium]
MDKGSRLSGYLPTVHVMTDLTDLTELTTDQLAAQLTSWAGRIAAGEARLLELLAEFDEREGWGAVGVLSCAHWLVWKLGLSPATAREKVRVARALRGLPLTATALSEARLSYAQARAITRVAASADEHQWVDLARYTTAAQLEKAVRGVRRSRLLEEK